MMHDKLMIRACETLTKYTDTNERYCRPSMRGAQLPILRASIGGGCGIVADFLAIKYLCHMGGSKTAGNPLL